MSNISFADDAWSEYLYWQTQDKKTLKKINALLKEIQRNPFDGAGKPEPLKNDKSGLWSRRIKMLLKGIKIIWTILLCCAKIDLKLMNLVT